MNRAILIVDMQRGFLEEGFPLYCGEGPRSIIPRVRDFLVEAMSQGATLIFTQDWHDPDDPEFKIWPPHCVGGTPEAEIVPELRELAEASIKVRKKRYTAFWETDLDKILYDLEPEEFHVVGVCTDICVLHTVADLRLRFFERDIYVHRDMVASFNPDGHRWALDHMEKVLRVKLV